MLMVMVAVVVQVEAVVKLILHLAGLVRVGVGLELGLV
jgi:hypothetical protein